MAEEEEGFLEKLKENLGSDVTTFPFHTTEDGLLNIDGVCVVDVTRKQLSVIIKDNLNPNSCSFWQIELSYRVIKSHIEDGVQIDIDGDGVTDCSTYFSKALKNGIQITSLGPGASDVDLTLQYILSKDMIITASLKVPLIQERIMDQLYDFMVAAHMSSALNASAPKPPQLISQQQAAHSSESQSVPLPSQELQSQSPLKQEVKKRKVQGGISIMPGKKAKK